MKRTIACAFALATIFAVAGCSNEQSPVTAEEAAGPVVWYTSQNLENAEALASAFEQDTGISVEVMRASAADIVQRFGSEREAGTVNADVITISPLGFFEDSTRDGAITELTAEEVPALSAWPDEHVLFSSTVRVGMQPDVVTYNTDLVAETDVPTTWEDLLEPRFKGEILFVDPRNSPAWLASLNLLEQELGPEFLEGLGSQDLTLVDSVVPGAQQLAAGEKSILVPNWNQFFQPLVDEGAPIGSISLEPMSGVEFLSAIASEAPHPAESRLFLEFMMSNEGQSIFNGPTASSPIGVTGTADLPAGYHTPDSKGAAERADYLLGLLGL